MTVHKQPYVDIKSVINSEVSRKQIVVRNKEWSKSYWVVKDEFDYVPDQDEPIQEYLSWLLYASIDCGNKRF